MDGLGCCGERRRETGEGRREKEGIARLASSSLDIYE